MHIGIDIGGTKIEAVLLDDTGAVVKHHRVPTDAQRSADEIISRIQAARDAVWQDGVRGVGVAFAGVIRDGVVVAAPNISALIGTDLRATLGGQAPVAFDNDARCFALAEHRFGSARGTRQMVGITLGTGVGSGVIINGRPYSGASGIAGEIGHMRLLDGHDWEFYLSGPAIVRQYMENGGSEQHPHPRLIWESEEPAAIRTRKEWLERCGLFLASIINSFNPERIVIGGGVSNLPFFDQLPELVRPHCFGSGFEACSIVRHELESPVAVGAALLHE